MKTMFRGSGAQRRCLCAVLVFAACGVPGANEGDSGLTAASEGENGGAWQFRLDSQRSDPGEFRLAEDGEGLRILTGPAGIAYRPDDEVRSGDFQVSATFAQFGAPVGYREAFGLFVGGLDLDSPDQEYLYLLIRGTGDFLIKRRRGEATETIVDWTPNAAVRAVTDEVAEPENHLAITSLGDETVFLVNGVAVHGMPTPEARPHGIVGVRANHRLDVRVTDWTLGAPVPTS